MVFKDCAERTRGVCGRAECDLCRVRSFASHPKAQYWGVSNVLQPWQVGLHSHTAFSFACPDCPHSFTVKLYNVVAGKWCPYCVNQKLCGSLECDTCFGKSFMSHLKAEYWDYDVNAKTPLEIFKSTNKSFGFVCGCCDHKFMAAPANVVAGKWCSYCAHRKICQTPCEVCYKMSFAPHPMAAYWSVKNALQPWQMFANSTEFCIFDCYKCGHEFSKNLNDVYQNVWCPYCAGKRLCTDESCQICFKRSFASHPRAADWDYSKNGDFTPRQVALSSSKYMWFVCPDCGCSFSSMLGNVAKGVWCPGCKNKTERKVKEYLQQRYSFSATLGVTFKHQPSYEWCKHIRRLPFDFSHDDLHLIIEIDGQQHYEHIAHWKTDPITIQKRDRYKEACARKQGYSVYRFCQMDIFYDRADWRTSLKTVIQ